MTYLDILLHIDSYPKPTPDLAIDEAIAIAAQFGGKITGLAVEVIIPMRSNRLADYLIGLSAIADGEEARSRKASQEGLKHFTSHAKAANVFDAAISARVNHFDVADYVAKLARTRDLCILPLVGGYDGQLEVAKSVVFSSGRPMLIFRSGEVGGLVVGPNLVVVAWDGSRNAARALADALPILALAKQVRILSVLDDKPDVEINQGADAQRHLMMHGVPASLDEVKSDGQAIGSVLDRYVQQHKPDLLVMGAYGHSRAREFLLGGATEHTLNDPPCPVLLSH